MATVSELVKDGTTLAEVQEAVRRGEVDVTETDCSGNNILHKVCSLNVEKPEVIEYLISVGAAVNQVNREGCTALIICASKGYLDTLRVLLTHGACVNPHGAVKQGHDSAVIAAAENGHEDCVNELIKHGADMWYRNGEGRNLLAVSCSKGLSNVVKHCIENGKGVETEKNKALSLACTNGHVDCVKILLDDDRHLTNLTQTQYGSLTSSPVLTAAKKKHENCVLELMSHGHRLSDTDSKGESLLMVACTGGLVTVVKRCLEMLDKNEVDKCDREGKTALMYACDNKEYGCLQELLSSGKVSMKTVDKTSKLGFTALMVCAQNGFIEGMKLLIQYKANVDIVISDSDGYYRETSNRDQNSALMLSAEAKHENCVRELIDYGADIWYTNKKGQNLLMVACAQGLLEIVQYCLSHGSFVQITSCDEEGNTALFHSYKTNKCRDVYDLERLTEIHLTKKTFNKKCMKELLLSGPLGKSNDILITRQGTHSRDNLIHMICKEKVERPDIVELLVSNSSMVDSIDSDGCTPLMICARNGSFETLKVLIKHGASLNIVQGQSARRSHYGGDYHSRNTALLMAADAGHQECVLELIDNGADIWHVNNNGKSLLTLASARGLIQVVSRCIGMRKSAHTQPENLNRALLVTVQRKHEACALEIMKHGADVWYTNEDGDNVLMLAARNGLLDIVKTCVSKGSTRDINKKNNREESALILALKNGHYDCAKEIPNAENLTFWDVAKLSDQVMYSTMKNKKELVELLVSKGLSVNEEIGGQSLLAHCAKSGDHDTMKTLLDLGADVNVSGSAENNPPLMMAALRGYEKCVSELIAHGADITRTNQYGQTLLMIAAEVGLLNTVKVCLEKGSQSFINMVDKGGKNAVMHACNSAHTSCLEEILKSQKCELGETTTSAIEVCSRYGYDEALQLLNKYGPVPDKHSITPQVVKSKVNVNLKDDVLQRKKAELLFAAERGRRYEQRVFDLIDNDTDIWFTDNKGKNLLMIAAQKGMANVVRYCVSKATCENLHAIDNDGNTAIMLAYPQKNVTNRYDSDDLECLAEIVKSDEAFNKKYVGRDDKYTDIDAEIYGSNQSLMHVICNNEKERADILECLIQKDASVHTFDAEGYTPLMKCAARGHTRSLKILLEARANPNVISKLVSNQEIKSQGDRKEKRAHIVDLGLLFGLVMFSCNDSKDSNARGRLDTHGNTALLLAAAEGHEGCVLELVSHGADVWSTNSKGENLLMLASAKGFWKTVKMCLSSGVPKQINACDDMGNNAVIHACKNSQLNCLNLLLNNPYCLDQVNVVSEELDMSSLMLAVHNKCIDEATLLLSKGADPNLGNKKGVSPLMVALGKVPMKVENEKYFSNTRSTECLEFARLLLQHGANVNHVCRQTGETALTVAVANRASVIEELLKHGANVNHTENNGKTALKIACEHDQEKIIRLLLRNGASVTINLSQDEPWERHHVTHQLLVLAGLQAKWVNKILEAKDGVVPKLFDLCRIPARQHVMNSFPNSNLFHTIPRLFLPQKMKDFLLFHVAISDNDTDDFHLDSFHGDSRVLLRRAFLELTGDNTSKDTEYSDTDHFFYHSDNGDDDDDYDYYEPSAWDCYEGSDTYSDFYD